VVGIYFEWNGTMSFFWWLEFILNGMEQCLFLVVGIYFEQNGTMPFVIFVCFFNLVSYINELISSALRTYWRIVFYFVFVQILKITIFTHCIISLLSFF
jgi:hypothetical protein